MIQPRFSQVGIGPTGDLSLRVSVAVLIRLLFQNPMNGVWMLALERKATLYEKDGDQHVAVSTQPFGGAVRILDSEGLHGLIGDYHFDSKRSRSERDFRLFIHPRSWPILREYCLAHNHDQNERRFSTDPGHELREELWDTLRVKVCEDQYTSRAVGVVVADQPMPTVNHRALGYPTARIYFINEVILKNDVLVQKILTGGVHQADQELGERAMQEAQAGGIGRANAALALPLKPVVEHYGSLSPQERQKPICYENNRLAEKVGVVLEGLDEPKYQNY